MTPLSLALLHRLETVDLCEASSTMALKKKKPTSLETNPRAPLATPASSLSNTQASSPTTESTIQKDWELLNFWLKTQTVLEPVRKSWENLKQKLSAELQTSTVQPLPSGITNKIIQELENLNKHLDRQEANPSYAQAAAKTSSAQIPLASRILKEVLVHPGHQTPDMANRTHVQLFQALQDRLPSSYNKQIRAVRKLPSGDILIHTESQETKLFLEKDSSWTATIFNTKAIVQPKRFPVLVHGVRTADIQPENLEDTCKKIQTSNPSLGKQITILRAYWSKKSIAQKKQVTSLHLDLSTRQQANLLIENGLVLGHRLHEVEPFLANTVIAQCFKCFGCGHQAHACRNRTACGACGGQHERRACPIPENLLKPKYCNCQGSHPAWASTCPVRQEAAKKAREAWISRPGKYKIPISTSLTPVPQSPATSFSFSQPLPGRKNVKRLSQPEAQRESGEAVQKFKFLGQDQQIIREKYQPTLSRSLKIRCLHERLKAHTSPV